MGSRLGQRASKCVCLVVPPLFRADLGTNLFKQGGNVKERPLAQRLSCLTKSERPWVRVPVGPRFFTAPVTLLYIMLHTKYHGHRSIGSVEDCISFYHIWARRSCCLCDLDCLNSFSLPRP